MTDDEARALGGQHLFMADMALCCGLCERDTWNEHDDPPEEFHADSCPLRGIRAAHTEFVNYEYYDRDRRGNPYKKSPYTWAD